jgi:hypothetical protein
VSATRTPHAGVVGSARSLTHQGALARVLAFALAWDARLGAHRADAR